MTFLGTRPRRARGRRVMAGQATSGGGVSSLSGVGKLRGAWVVREVGGETVLFETRHNRAYWLGRVVSAVWREWGVRGGPAALSRRVSRRLGEPVDEASIRVAARHLRRAGLIGVSWPWRSADRERPRSVARRSAASVRPRASPC